MIPKDKRPTNKSRFIAISSLCTTTEWAFRLKLVWLRLKTHFIKSFVKGPKLVAQKQYLSLKWLRLMFSGLVAFYSLFIVAPIVFKDFVC